MTSIAEPFPDAFPGIICATCGDPLRVCVKCIRQDRWFLYCLKQHCRARQATDYGYTHKHDFATDSGERRYRWEPSRQSEQVGCHRRNTADTVGRVRILVFLVQRRGKPGVELNDRRSGQRVLGNAHRSITLAEGRVTEIAAAIRAALCDTPPETCESDEALPTTLGCHDEGS